MDMDLRQLQAKMEKYIKPEYQEEANKMIDELDMKRKAGTLSKMDLLTKLPRVQNMIKPEYRDKAIGLLSQLNRIK